jgi:hypothetical protein
MRIQIAIVLAAVLPGVGGCAAPFEEVRAGGATGKVAVASCGVRTGSTGSVVRAMDGPPSEIEGRSTAPSTEFTVCVKLDNQGGQPIKVDRSHLHLKTPRARDTWVPDAADEVFVVPPGTAKRFDITFKPAPLLAGEDVSVLFDGAIYADGRPMSLPPIVLRKK